MSTSSTYYPPAAALTSIWTPPCGTTAFQRPLEGRLTESSQCFPPKWESYWYSEAGYYSPAICPSGFTPGCTRYAPDTNPGVLPLTQGPPPAPGETAWLCVVRGYTCVTDALYFYAFSGSTSIAMIQIRWQSSDLSVLETHPLAAITPTGSPPTESGPASTPPPNPALGTSNPGLSTAAKAGIGVGVGVAVLLLVAVIIFIRRHRSTHLKSKTAEDRVEVGDTSRKELDGTSKPVEKPATPVLFYAELPSHTISQPLGVVSPPSQQDELKVALNLDGNQIDSSHSVQNIEFTEAPASTPPSNPPDHPKPTETLPVRHDVPAYSDLPEVNTTALQPESELEDLLARREALDNQRLRILQLQQIEEERLRLDQRISQLKMEKNRGLR